MSARCWVRDWDDEREVCGQRKWRYWDPASECTYYLCPEHDAIPDGWEKDE